MRLCEKDCACRAGSERAACTVLALSTALHVTRERAADILAAHGRKRSCAAKRKTTHRAYAASGLRCVTYKRTRTLERFVREHEGGTYIVRVSGHVFVLADGLVHPCGSTPPPRARITNYWRAADENATE